MASIDRRMWRDFFMRQYGEFSARVRKIQDFATFTDDTQLILKWRHSRSYDDWLPSFERYAASWGQVTKAPRANSGMDPATNKFLEWFERLSSGYLMFDDQERLQLLDWLSQGAELPPADVMFSEAVRPAGGSKAPAEPDDNSDGSSVAC